MRKKAVLIIVIVFLVIAIIFTILGIIGAIIIGRGAVCLKSFVVLAYHIGI